VEVGVVEFEGLTVSTVLLIAEPLLCPTYVKLTLLAPMLMNEESATLKPFKVIE